MLIITLVLLVLLACTVEGARVRFLTVVITLQLEYKMCNSGHYALVHSRLPHTHSLDIHSERITLSSMTYLVLFKTLSQFFHTLSRHTIFPL